MIWGSVNTFIVPRQSDFRWVFISKELDTYKDRVNNTAKRADRNIVLPHGAPNFDPASIAHVRKLYAPPDHEVFQLVSPDFVRLAAEFYSQIDRPPITRTNVWDIYMNLLRDSNTYVPHPAQLDDQWGYNLAMAREDYEDDLALIPNLTPLHNGSEVVGPNGYYYMGGVNKGLGLDDGQGSRLNVMMEHDELLPEGEVELEEGDQLMAWFSDKEEPRPNRDT
ncbi:hypothetical protein C8F04DRAFT_1187840 [Mycena alexandri]|uniref:Uncharacterized protein n=1 Tax=Mycena alexandri TaxID=1745969 RepID=A0AAD6SJM0_9AGAR|nr:hypothetical protein C8F04DRAFT_1187840 [Mycena alexandri]